MIDTLTNLENMGDLQKATDFAGFVRLVTGADAFANAVSNGQALRLFRALSSLWRRPGGSVELRLASAKAMGNALAAVVPASAEIR